MQMCTPNDYFRYMEADIIKNRNSSWLEAFCQRAMMLRGYSVKNVSRILLQFPEAVHVAGKQQYEDSGIHVLPFATPIRIYAPVAKGKQKAAKWSAVDVYDISQTTAAGSKRRMRFLPPAAHLKKMCLLAKASNLHIVSANLTSGPWKILERDTLYVKEGIPLPIASQLIAQELAKIAIEKEHPEFLGISTSIAAVTSYALEIGMGFQIPNLGAEYKIPLATSGRLLSYVELAVRVAKRISVALK